MSTKKKETKPKKFKKKPWMKHFSITKKPQEEKTFDLFLFRNCRGTR